MPFSADMVSHLIACLQENDSDLRSISWTLSVLENPNVLHRREDCERRTYVSFCEEEFSAPTHFKLEKGPLADTIFKALGENSTVQTLLLKGHNGLMRANFSPHLTDSALLPLCECLRINSTLTHVDLSNNSIGNSGAAALAGALEGNTTLRLLNLKNNFIGRDGLVALANSLVHNKVLDEVAIGQQFWRGNHLSRDFSVSNDLFARSIVNLIEDAFLRKKELLHPLSSGATFFHGFLTKAEAEARLASQANGSFLLYLNKFLPSAVMLSFKNSNLHANNPALPSIILHKALYRVNFGYSFSAQPGAVCSLVETLGWFIKQDSLLLEQCETSALLPTDILDKFRPVWEFHHLWGLRSVPVPEMGHTFTADSFSCLQQMVARNRSFLVYPVPRPLSAAPSPATSSHGQDGVAKS